MSAPTVPKSGLRSVFSINRRKCVIIIAVLEMIYSVAGSVGYWYASYTYPLFQEYLNFILPSEFLNDSMVIGLINSLSILCGFEFVLALILLDGARFIRLGRIRFWLTSIFTYKVLTCVLVVGMELANGKAAEFNAYMFFGIFVRFVEILLVYIFLEEETLKRLRLKIRHVRANTEALSSATSYSNISIENEVLEDVVSSDPDPEPIMNGTNTMD